jgi:WD40 repeat protein
LATLALHGCYRKESPEKTLIGTSQKEAASPLATVTPRAGVDTGTKRGVDCVAMSADGHVLIDISDHMVKVWEMPAGKELWHFKDEHGAGLDCVAISPDGKTAAHASHASITLHDVGTGKQLHRLFHKGLISGLCFSPDGSLLVAGGQTVITGWDAKSGQERFVWGPQKKRGQWITALSEFFNASGQIASGSEDGTIKVWDIAAGKLLKTFSSGPQAEVKAIGVSADGKLLAAIKHLNLIEVWDVSSGRLLNSLQRQTGIFPRCFFLPDGKTLVYPGGGNRICVERIDVGQERCRLEGHNNPVWSLGLAADGSTLASGDRDGIIKIWDLKSLP